MLRQIQKLFSLRHGSPPLHAGQNHGLTHTRQRILFFQNGRCGKKGTDPWNHLILDPQLVQPVHLLPVRTIDGRISRMYSRYFFPFVLRFLYDLNHFLQVHGGAVIDNRLFLCVRQHLRIHQRSRIDDHIRAVNDLLSFDRQKFRVSGTRSDK